MDASPNKKFHVLCPVDPVEIERYEMLNGVELPTAYREFAMGFGDARMFRKSNYYQLRVLGVPIDPILVAGHIACQFAYADETKFYFLPRESNDVYTIRSGKFSKVSASFDAWLHATSSHFGSRVSEDDWKREVNLGVPFSLEELKLVEARERFSWSYEGVAQNGDLRLKVFNGSQISLPFLSLGVRGRSSRGTELRGYTYLNVEGISPGNSATLLKSVYKGLIAPDAISVYSLPAPAPEDREIYWEFQKNPDTSQS